MQKKPRNRRTLADKRKQERYVIARMITIYCKGHRGFTGHLCHECQELIDYAHQRIESCPFMETKTFCSNCRVHCYQEQMRTRVREVMRYSGPRLFFHHPILAIRHLIEAR